jgi:AcrR family transcriptional regulator
VAEAQLHEDPLRGRLLDAAIRVFARQGYAGTKVLDIVREAGLSTGAIYGRFRSKEDLLREAVVSRSKRWAHLSGGQPSRVADLITRGASLRKAPLSDDDAVRLEAYVAARREPEVAGAVSDSRRGWRSAIQPLVDAAVTDGTVASDVDAEAVLFFVQTMHLGLLLQRGAGAAEPDPTRWDELMARIVASFGELKATSADDAQQGGKR